MKIINYNLLSDNDKIVHVTNAKEGRFWNLNRTYLLKSGDIVILSLCERFIKSLACCCPNYLFNAKKVLATQELNEYLVKLSPKIIKPTPSTTTQPAPTPPSITTQPAPTPPSITTQPAPTPPSVVTMPTPMITIPVSQSVTSATNQELKNEVIKVVSYNWNFKTLKKGITQDNIEQKALELYNSLLKDTSTTYHELEPPSNSFENATLIAYLILTNKASYAKLPRNTLIAVELDIKKPIPESPYICKADLLENAKKKGFTPQFLI